MPFILRATLPKSAACRAACGTPERSKGAKLSAKGAEVGVGGVSPLTEGGEGVWGLPQENVGFDNALRVSFRLSEVHI